jgi:hypothetical protein
MRTLFLGSYGFGNLGDELCLIDAIKAFPSREVWAFTADPAFTAHCVRGIDGFIRDRHELRELKPERVVLGGGGVGFFPSIRDMLHWMDDALRLGAECHVYNIGVAYMSDLSWVEVAEVQRILSHLKSCSVRDDMSWMCIRGWPATLGTVNITMYPEYKLKPDLSLVGLLPDGPKRGISITGQKAMRQALDRNHERVAIKLAEYEGYHVIPIVSTVSLTDPEEDDVAGFRYFAERFFPSQAIACEEFLDKRWWRSNMTPLKLKGLIGGLDVLFTQRKHNLIHAIGTQTPSIGIYPVKDDSISRIFFSMRGKIPLHSSELPLLDE